MQEPANNLAVVINRIEDFSEKHMFILSEFGVLFLLLFFKMKAFSQTKYQLIFITPYENTNSMLLNSWDEPADKFMQR